MLLLHAAVAGSSWEQRPGGRKATNTAPSRPPPRLTDKARQQTLLLKPRRCMLRYSRRSLFERGMG